MNTELIGRTERILAGMPKRPSDHAIFDGEPGYWIQGDCVFVVASDIQTAMDRYRSRISKAHVACDHNGNCDGIKNAEYMECLRRAAK